MVSSKSSALLERNGELLYQQVSQHIQTLIDQGTLRPGERVPSVRKLSRQLDVSVSTVLQAYRQLEDARRIEARPQSGYYVRLHQWRPPAEPEISRPSSTSTHVNTGELVMQFMTASRRADIVPLGAAIAGPEALPVRQLNRIQSSIGRRRPSLGAAYDIPPGCLELRTQVARRAMDAGCTLGPDDIVTTSGSQEALGLALRAVAKPGDTIAIESPTYYGVLQTIEVLGMKALEVPTHPRSGVCLESLGRALRQSKIKACLFVPNFNNPLGSLMPDDAKKKLVRLLEQREIPLIEDDIYGDLCFSAERPKTCKAFDTAGNVLLVSSFSKTLAPGYRVGWCAPGRFRDAFARLKFFTTLANAILPQMAVAEFLASAGYDHHLRRVRKVHAENIARVTQAVCAHFPAGTKATRPAGGFVLWVELPEGTDAMKLYDRAMEEDISIAPGPIFSPKRKFKNFVRLNCGNAWTPRIEGAIEAIGRLAKRI
ncbi:MAG TPA: PLP-dependent aminotransferase family protein [Tepidisphaeraceae bacterium]|jgi:DNA-binding transcriptional MocR family regulator|nr:PLP-dependent aminotransferase family protein [Tepidisphaeraceae bacterium]